MWCTVYPLYAHGKRLSAEAAKARGHYGWLYMRPKVPITGQPDPRAYLLPAPPASTDAPILSSILELECCTLRAISRGIRLTGLEPRPPSSWTVHRQSWWIIPGARP
ncbi:hypothetical protein CT3_27930 [Comamonas terrigena NBRC 13299]|nr:hypothetical protein CT3_27930 [Comamonas terrigena NBRC 13299]